MEISWKWLNSCLGLLFFQLCNGLPLNLEDTVADQHTQFLTGLVAVLLTVCSVVLLAGCLCCQRRNGFKEFRDIQVTASTTTNLDHGHVNPIANGEFTIFTPLSPPHYNNNVFLANEQIIVRTPEDYICGDIDVSSWFNGPEKDFPRVKLKYIRELGTGWFGKVVEGAAQGVNPEQTWSAVIVRILDATATSKERLLFLHDAEIYRYGSHPNILRLIGRCLDTVPLLLLHEHCSQGDLKGYLRANQANAEKLLSTEYPLMWCCQLTSALKHLHENKVVHNDLATRNCQLTTSLSLKLGDYGLAASKYPQDYYTGSLSVPLRWCSPESLACTPTTIQPKKITPESNIWSLGVTMWEIYECGRQPYEGLNDDEVVSQVFGPSKVRLQRPIHPVLYTDYIFRLMQLCWTNAESRPSVSQIDLMLTDLMQVHKNRNSLEKLSSADDFDKRWESLKPNVIVKTDDWKSDTVSIDIGDERETKLLKPLSASLKNLHGSLDDLTDVTRRPAESWLEVEGKRNSLDNTLILERQSSSDSDPPCKASLNSKSKINFRLGPSSVPTSNQKSVNLFNQHDSFTDSISFKQRSSSDSETEDENWRKKVERGAYTEKVRLKSRSVADLMVLTHVDYSESESETPLHSLDYKNFRYPPKNNLESLSVTFTSEGNLLNVEDKFQEELKKLQVERRDSLLFVPDNHSQTSSVLEPSLVVLPNNKRLMEELNSPSEIEPANQIYNVFNVTIDKYTDCPLNVKLSSANLSEIINLKCNDGTNIDDLSFTRQDSENKSDLGYNTLHNSERNSEFGGSVDEENISEFRDEFCQKEDAQRQVEDVDKENIVEEFKKSEIENIQDTRVENTHIKENHLIKEGRGVESQENIVETLQNNCKLEELTSEYESDELGLQEESDFVQSHQNTADANIELVNERNYDSDYVKRLSGKLEGVLVDDIMDEMINHLKEEREQLIKENRYLEKRELTVHNKESKHEEMSLEAFVHLPKIQQRDEEECSAADQTSQIIDIREVQDDTNEDLKINTRIDKELESHEDLKSHTEKVEEPSRHKELSSGHLNDELELDTEEAAICVCNKNDNLDYVKKLSIQIQNADVDSYLVANVVDEMIQHLKEERGNREELSIPEKFKRRKTEDGTIGSSEHLPGISESEENECDDLKENHNCEEEHISEVGNKVRANGNLEAVRFEKVIPSKDVHTNIVADFLITEVKNENKYLEIMNTAHNIETPYEKCQHINESDRILTDSREELAEDTRPGDLFVSNRNIEAESDTVQVESEGQIYTNVPKTEYRNSIIFRNDIEETVGVTQEQTNTVQDHIHLPGNIIKNTTDLISQDPNSNEDMLISNISASETKIEKCLQDLKSELRQTFVNSIINEAEDTVNNLVNVENNRTDDEKLEILSKTTDVIREVPKLCDIIQNNDKLMDYIIANYDDLDKEKTAPESENEIEPQVPKDNNEIKSDCEQLKHTNSEFSFDSDRINSLAFDNLTFQNEQTNHPQVLGTTETEDVVSSVNNIKLSETIHNTPYPIREVPNTDLDSSSPKECDSQESKQTRVVFDLSDHQEEAMPNSLTHSTVFTSTPFGKKQELSLPSQDAYSSLNLFDVKPDEAEEELLRFSSNFAPLGKSPDNKDLRYSLETWDNFLGKTLDYQQPENDDLFDSFSSEPRGLLFLDNDMDKKVANEALFLVEENEDDYSNTEFDDAKKDHNDGTFVVEDKKDGSFMVDDKKDGTFVVEDKKDSTFVIEDGQSVFSNKNVEQELEEVAGTWETGGGWFLHPQSNNDHLSGDMQMPSTSRTDSYVGFGMDDEIMAAIRNELLQKLPHAQGASTDKVREEEEEWESEERNEVFLRYNVYNTPLSPIPEESFLEGDEDDYSSGENSPKKQMEEIDSDWSDPAEPENLAPDITTPTNDNSIREPAPNRHTPSQDSCCSNDTLFNLEELTCAEKDNLEAKQNELLNELSADNEGDKTVTNEDDCTLKPEDGSFESEFDEKPIKSDDDVTFCAVNVIKDQIDVFLTNERHHGSITWPVGCENGSNKSSSDETPSTSAEEKLVVPFSLKNVAPLPSPEDNPWRQLPASLLSYDKVTQNSLLPDSDIVPENSESQESNTGSVDKEEDLSPDLVEHSKGDSKPNEDLNQEKTKPIYPNIIEDITPESDESIDYANSVMYENLSEKSEPVSENKAVIYENLEEPKPAYENLEKCVDDIYNEADYVNIVNMENTKNSEFSKDDNEENLDYMDSYGSHHEDLIIKNDVDDDDNEFYGVLTDIRFSGPTDNQMMSTSFSESNDNDEQDWDSGSDTRSTSSGEFIWKEGEHEESLKALRAAPQDVFEDVKPLEGITEETTSESEASTSSDEDGETPEFVPSAWDKYATPMKSALRSPEKTLERSERRKSKGVWFKKQKYHCVYEYPREPESPVLQSQDLWKPETDYTAFAGHTGAEDEFFISGSARPFDISSLSSQFFPGNSNWIENATPDSGVEDTTPGSITDPNDYPNAPSPKVNTVQSLRKLASDAVNQGKVKTSEVLGGMRHTRNKLKLDLPPSPSAFTATKTFTVEEPQEPIVVREKPTFSTFGKSRFLVQHVETPPVDETSKHKNVSFEALPYKPCLTNPVGDKENTGYDIESASCNKENASYNEENTTSYNKILYEPLERHNDCNEGLGGKSKVEFVRGEASLLDSADEDSGIESSTLERKLSSVTE